MKNTTIEAIKDITKKLEKNYDFNDTIRNYIDDDDLKECTTISEVLYYFRDLDENGDITNVDVIYYSNAIEYLQENDPSLQNSMQLARDFGYDTDSINSELLASLLQTENNREDYAKFIDDLESELLNSCLLD